MRDCSTSSPVCCLVIREIPQSLTCLVRSPQNEEKLGIRDAKITESGRLSGPWHTLIVVTRVSDTLSELARYWRALRRRLSWWIAPEDPSDPSRHAYYGQVRNCQVKYLWHIYSTFLGAHAHGYFVEVVANDGIHVSNTWGLANAGWRGWLIEPVPDYAELCRRNYSEFPNICVCEIAIGAPGVDSVDIRITREYSTASPEFLTEVSELPWAANSISQSAVRVPVETLDEFLERHKVPPGSYVLVVDVEGHEEHVFAGFEIDIWAPNLMIIELSDVHPELTRLRNSHLALGDQILRAGYSIAYKDHINTVFVREELWKSGIGPHT